MARKIEKQHPREALRQLTRTFESDGAASTWDARGHRFELDALFVELRWGLDMLQSRVKNVASGGDADEVREAVAAYLRDAAVAVEP